MKEIHLIQKTSIPWILEQYDVMEREEISKAGITG